MSHHAAVITGVGAVTAAGCGSARLAEVLASSQVIKTEVDRSAGYHRAGSARTAVTARHVDTSEWLSPLAARRMSVGSRYAVSAARMAVESAAVEPDTLSRASITVGTAYGAAEVTEKLLRQILLDGPEAASPALFTESVANAPAAQVAISMGVKGPNVTITQRQASPLLALAEGAAMVTTGRVPVGLVGAVDELNPLLHSVLDRFGALARPDQDGCEVARPFDVHRRGFLAGDGAAFLVLEDRAAARRRGARILCRVVTCGRGFDPDAPRAGWGRDPSALAETLSRHLHAAGITAEQIDLIVASGCGSPSADRIEALVLRSVFKDHPLPPLLAPKSVTGDHGGGFLAASVLAACGSPFGATPGFDEPDPELGVVPHQGGELSAPRLTLITSFAAGGAVAWAVLERAEE